MAFNTTKLVLRRAIRPLRNFKLITVVLTVLLLVFYSFSYKKISTKPASGSQLAKEHPPDSPNPFFDDLCEMNGEWELLGREIYIKRGSAFYITEVDLLRFYIVTSSMSIYTNDSFALTLTFINKDSKQVAFKSTVTKNIHLVSHRKLAEYHVMFLDVVLGLAGKDLTPFDVFLAVQDSETEARTKKSLKVTTTYTHTSQGDARKHGSMMCTKCLRTKSNNDHVSLKWWIELHKRIGYTKIFLCDHRIEKASGFRQILNQYKDLLQLDSFKCIPNLVMNRSTTHRDHLYLTSFDELARDEVDLLNEIVLNECYMTNMDKYRFISVGDVDEAVMPRRLGAGLRRLNQTIQHITSLRGVKKIDLTDPNNSLFKNLKCRVESSVRFEDSLDELRSALNATGSSRINPTHDYSYRFKQGTFLPNRLAARIFSSLEKVLNGHPKRLRVEVLKKTNSSNTSFALTITTKRELRYAINLLNLYKTTLKAFFERRTVLANSSFNRFFFVAGEVNNGLAGKSVHSTRRTLGIDMHRSTSGIDFGQRPPVRYYTNERDDDNELTVTSQFGHVGHFRTRVDPNFDLSNIPFHSLHLDLNYLFCYFVPMMRQFEV
jgi:hypothetical protein